VNISAQQGDQSVALCPFSNFHFPTVQLCPVCPEAKLYKFNHKFVAPLPEAFAAVGVNVQEIYPFVGFLPLLVRLTLPPPQ
jgi:hypothetical protein